MERWLKVDVDAILMLRIQKERMKKDTIPSEKKYFENLSD